jgi:hypothetical protein
LGESSITLKCKKSNSTPHAVNKYYSVKELEYEMQSVRGNKIVADQKSNKSVFELTLDEFHNSKPVDMKIEPKASQYTNLMR